jgi:glucose/arabinose dehydrogenase
MFGKTIFGLFGLLAVACASPEAYAAPVAKVVSLGDFTNPVYVAVAPGEPKLLFVVERIGLIQVLQNEKRLAQPFLDIRSLVLGPPDAGAGGEQGLFSVAFPPNYLESRRLYVAYTNNEGDIEIDEFRSSDANPTRVNIATRRVLLVIAHRGAQNHNGGQLQFDPDGLLYISTGDGGNVSPPGEPARNLNSLLGKILRIRPLPVGTSPYRIPQSNPFVGKAGRDEIFAYGLRNPWRFSLDGDRIIIADVGQSKREEVNFLRTVDAAGVNFGWPQFEGDVVFDNTRPGPGPAKFPIFTYDHNGGRCAIIGGYVVRDASIPALKGRYLYGDLCTGELRIFYPKVDDQETVGDKPIGITLAGLSSFGEGFHGRIYTTQINGRVSRLAPP